MKKLFVCTTALLLLLLLANPVYAYLDPGTGSMLIQGLLAAIAAASVTIGIFWRRLRSFFSRKNSGENGPDDS
ncbi:MAG: hypothetical protein U9P49_04810 [Thermodesulfobacteriota bacterium]|nr:hypothetical protein [Thermodesulfobacteriota bacterium]